MNSVPKLFSCCYADCWTENHFSTEFSVLTLNCTHSHTLFWGCVSRWFGRALAWHARGQRFDPAILHQKGTVFRRKYGAFRLIRWHNVNSALHKQTRLRNMPSLQSASAMAHSTLIIPKKRFIVIRQDDSIGTVG